MSRNTESFNFKNLIHVSYRCDIPIFRIGKFQGIAINIDYHNAYIQVYTYICITHTCRFVVGFSCIYSENGFDALFLFSCIN